MITSSRVILAALACTCLAYWAGLALVSLDKTHGHVIGSDGLFYYEYLPSLFIDGDIDFKNQREQLIREGVPYGWSGAMTEPVAATGLLGTPFSVGWSLLCSPFFAVAHVLARVTHGRSDGYGFLYESVTNFGAVLWGCAGVWFLFLTQRKLLPEWQAALLALGALAATNLDYYIVVQASMSHAPGFFAISLALYCLVDALERPQEPKRAWLFGLASGLAFLIRPQLALAIAPMFVYAFLQGVSRAWLARAVVVGAVVGCLQLVVWHTLYGSFLTLPQGESFLKLSDPSIVGVLFSMRHGLFVWHPGYLLCVIGLCLPERYVRFRVLSLVCIALQIYINASAADWWAGNAFGNRRFIEMLPFFAMGGAAWLRLAKTPIYAVAIVGALALWNTIFIVQYRFGFIPRGDAITLQQLTLDKLRLPFVPRHYQ